MSNFDVRDTRNRNWLWMRRELLREHGDRLGVYGIAVYAALASFADESNTAYPSIQSVADMIGCSTNKVRESINQLCQLGWIGYEEQHTDSGRQTSHLFYLLKAPVNGEGSQREGGTLHSMKGDPSRDEDEVETKEVEHKKSAHAHEEELPPHAPTLDRVVEYGTGQVGLSEEECEKFFNHYAAVDFMDGQQRKLNWKFKMANWKRNQGRFSHNGKESVVHERVTDARAHCR